MQIQVDAGRYKQIQANSRKYKQMQAIRMKTLENNSKLKKIDVKAGPPRINKP